MRIMAGSLKGRNVYSPPGREVRPTASLVRGAIFNILGDRIIRARILDLFAGSGILGLEAYSRGASEVIFVDRDRRCIAAIKKTISNFGIGDNWQVVQDDVLDFLARKQQPFDIILADPPYKEDLLLPMLRSISQQALLRPQGIFMYQHHPKLAVPDRENGLRLWKSRRHGRSQITFYLAAKEVR